MESNNPKYIYDISNKHCEQVNMNKKRVENKKLWLKILENEEQENNKVLDILFYLYDCKNYTSNGKMIAKDLNIHVAAINGYISSFGKRIIDLLNLDKQVSKQSKSRRWNIPFETVSELNDKHTFTWKLRKELIDALIEKYDLIPKEDISGEIDYNIEFVDFEYLSKHIINKKKNYRSRETDYEKINKNKKAIGNRGEKAILQYEINKLNSIGLTSLASQVTICDDDAIGYDIVSYNENEEEIHIEVKTNSGNKPYLDFYITDNELQHLKEEDNYYIYYLYNIKGKPKCHVIDKNSILKNETDFFQPVIYKVNIDVLRKSSD